MLLLILGFILSAGIKQFIIRSFRLRARIETENQQIKITVLRHVISVIQAIIWVSVLLGIAGILQMKEVVQIITLLGVVFGYVARDFFLDFIMGVLVLVEQQFRVGDTVTFTAVNQISTGKVTEIGIRTTKVRLQDTNDMYIVSNRMITSVVVHRRELDK